MGEMPQVSGMLKSLHRDAAERRSECHGIHGISFRHSGMLVGYRGTVYTVGYRG